MSMARRSPGTFLAWPVHEQQCDCRKSAHTSVRVRYDLYFFFCFVLLTRVRSVVDLLAEGLCFVCITMCLSFVAVGDSTTQPLRANDQGIPVPTEDPHDRVSLRLHRLRKVHNPIRKTGCKLCRGNAEPASNGAVCAIPHDARSEMLCNNDTTASDELDFSCVHVYSQVVAVNDLSLEMHHGQITALLGHNGAGNAGRDGDGTHASVDLLVLVPVCNRPLSQIRVHVGVVCAHLDFIWRLFGCSGCCCCCFTKHCFFEGKSTTIGMLTGLLRPTSGDAEIYGHSLVNSLDSVRFVRLATRSLARSVFAS